MPLFRSVQADWSEIKRMAASTAGDICTKEVVTADAEASVEYIATLMTEKKDTSPACYRRREINRDYR